MRTMAVYTARPSMAATIVRGVALAVKLAFALGTAYAYFIVCFSL